MFEAHAPPIDIGAGDRPAGGEPGRETPSRASAARGRGRNGKSRGKGRKAGRKGNAGRRPFLRRVIYWSFVLALWVVIAGIGGVAWIGAHLPPIQTIEIPKRPPSIKLVDINQRILLTRGDLGGAALALKELPPYVPNAFIAIEDRRFYSHHGVDPLGVARALVANVLHHGVSQGGSTLTQQLAKNLFLT